MVHDLMVHQLMRDLKEGLKLLILGALSVSPVDASKNPASPSRECPQFGYFGLTELKKLLPD